MRFVSRLPQHTHYAAAYQSSPEFAEWAVAEMERRRANPREAPSQLPSRVGWTPEVEHIVNLGDMVRELTNVTAYKDSDRKPPRLKPLPRPLSPFERAQQIAEQARHQARIDLLTPGR